MSMLADSVVSRNVIRSGQAPEIPDQTFIDDVIDLGKTARNGLNAYSHIPVVSTLAAVGRALLGVIEIVSSVALVPFYLVGMLYAPIDNGKNFLKSVGMIFRGLNDITRAAFEAVPVVGNAIVFASDALIGNVVSDVLDQKVFTRTYPLYKSSCIEEMSLSVDVSLKELLRNFEDEPGGSSLEELEQASHPQQLDLLSAVGSKLNEAGALSPSSNSNAEMGNPLLGRSRDSRESLVFSAVAYVPRKLCEGASYLVSGALSQGHNLLVGGLSRMVPVISV